MTFRADRIPPPPKTESTQELYRWNYRIFELLNAIQTLLATGIENTPAGLITGTDLQTVIGQINTLIVALQSADVTNGNAHDHIGGDGAQIAHTGLSSIGTNTHAQIDTAVTASTNHIAAASPHSGHEVTTAKDAASGYAGLNAASRTTKGVITTDDLIVDLATKGPVIKDSAGHYWRLGITTLGVPTWTDLGTSAP